MIKILRVEQIEENKFGVLIFADGKEKRYVVRLTESRLGNSNESIELIVPEDESFFDYWGQDLNFRKNLCAQMKNLAKKSQPELQAA